MVERTCCPDTDLIVFGHVSCDQAQPIRPAWTIQPSSTPPDVERAPDDFPDDDVSAVISELAARLSNMPPRPRRRRLLQRTTR